MRVSRCNNKIISQAKSLPRFISRHVSQNERKETPSCTCTKASYTLEAAIVFPVVTGFMVFVLMFFRVLQIQTAVEAALVYASRMTAVEACAVESDVALLASAEGFFVSKLSDSEVVEEYVDGGIWGISLLQSQANDENISLIADYNIKLPIGFFEIDTFNMSQKSVSRKWIGKAITEASEDYVYITDYGTVYHKSKSCSHLDLSINRVNLGEIKLLRNKNGGKYSACSKCAEKIPEFSMVYVTDYGTLYHGDVSCSALKRTIRIVPLSEVFDMPACSKCGGIK